MNETETETRRETDGMFSCKSVIDGENPGAPADSAPLCPGIATS